MKNLYVDTHVHLHPEFDVPAFFDAALAHFESYAASEKDPSEFVLCLTDVQGVDTCNTLGRLGSAGPWRFEDDDHGGLMCVQRDQDKQIALLPGRQIVSTEKLELLALDTHLNLKDRKYSLKTLAERALDENAIPVLPWGFGKWTGGRKTAIEDILRAGPECWVSDNGNRLAGSQEPELLVQCRDAGNTPLVGSDPLPFKHQQGKAGSYVVHWQTSHEGTARESFRQALDAGLRFDVKGGLASKPNFLRDQLAMQIRKRLRRAS